MAISFCSPEEKEGLDAIEHFLNAPIEKMTVSKRDYDYTATLELHSRQHDVMALIEAHENRKKKRKCKSRK